MKTNTNSLDQIIQSRKTSKILATDPLPGGMDMRMIMEMIETAGMAPFHIASAAHHRSGETMSSLVPWRFYVVPKEICLALRQQLIDDGDKTKVPDMLAATDTLIQVTWCPDMPEPGFEVTERLEYCPSRNNMEHIAASAAAVQNMLLLATERGIASYWSSGGPLRSKGVFNSLGIPTGEVLLGSVFLFAGDFDHADVEVRPGKMREKRGDLGGWCRQVDKLTV